jgi:uncharacterized membrane protein YfcA
MLPSSAYNYAATTFLASASGLQNAPAATQEDITKEVCKVASDCFSSFEICENAVCVHKALWPIDGIEWAGAIILCMVIGLAAASGIGGGSLIMPIALIFYGFSANLAVPLSNFCIFASSLILFIKNYSQNHPKVKGKVSIDYESVLILYPMVLAGTSIGVILSIILPGICITFALTGVLVFLLYKSSKKYVKLRKEERKAMEDKAKEVKAELISGDGPGPEAINTEISSPELTTMKEDENQKALDKILKEESSHLVFRRMAIILTLFLSLLFMQLARGNKHYESIVGVKACSPTDWSILGLIFVVCIGSFLLVVRMIRKKHQAKTAIGYKFVDGDLKYNNSTIVKLSILGVCGGISGGCLGIGGGMIFNPILMDMGMLPQVASATGMYLVLFSSCSTILQFTIIGKINWDYAMWLCFWSSLGTVAGMTIIGRLVKRSGRTSYILLCLLILIVTSAVVLPAQGIYNMIDRMDAGLNVFKFTSLCPAN